MSAARRAATRARSARSAALELLEASALEIGPGLRLPGTDLLAMDQRCLYCYLMQYAQLEAARKRAEELRGTVRVGRDRGRFTARR